MSSQSTSSSHMEVIDTSCVGECLDKPSCLRAKPALLPKPKISASDLRIAKSNVKQKIQSSSQTVFSVSEESQTSSQATIPVRQNPGLSSTNKSSSKPVPPRISPKPQLPPKTGALKSAMEKAAFHSQGDTQSPVRPPRSPKRTFVGNPFDSLPSRAPLAPSTSDPLPLMKEKSLSLGRHESLSWTARELNKSSKKPIRYYQQVVSKTIVRAATFDADTPTPKPRPRVKNKPRLRLVELDLASYPTSDGHVSCPIYATVDYSKKKNRRPQQEQVVVEEQTVNVSVNVSTTDDSFHSTSDELDTRRSSGSSESFKSLPDSQNSPEHVILTAKEENGGSNYNNNYNIVNMIVDDNHINHDRSYKVLGNVSQVGDVTAESGTLNTFSDNKSDNGVLNNNYTSTNNNYNCNYNNTEQQIQESSVQVDHVRTSDMSFLHRTAISSKSKQVEKTTEGEEKEEERDSNNVRTDSFLYRSEKRSCRVSLRDDSFNGPKVLTEAVERSVSTVRESSPYVEITKDDIIEALAKEPDPSHSLSMVCQDEGVEVTAVTKRFPWFGSFGKGHRKQSNKKERCASQFYTSTPESDKDLNERNRAVSLPDIKNTANLPCLQDEDRDWSYSNTESINSGSIDLQHQSDSDDDKDSLLRLDIHEDSDKQRTKAYLIAKELMTSEEVFIDVLRLLNVDFRNFVEFQSHENKTKIIPMSDLDKILNHLSQLQSLNEDLLSDLRKRIHNWESNPKIADVIVKKGAFLKMYTTYIQNFESQTKYLDECIARYPKFGKLVKEFESSERCKKLSLKHYMLKPVQRIPQYRLLLDDYLKHLAQESPDFEDTQNALKIVCEVADHANRSMKHGDKNGRMMQFQSLLSDFEMIRPGRELIKDGPLEKVCRKTFRERYFILLNDCLLHTTYSRNYLKIHQDLPLFGMKVCCNEEEKYPHSFTVFSITKSFILLAKSETERKEWVETLQKAIEDHISRQKTINVKIPETETDSFKLGKEAPVWIQDGKVTMCQMCTAEFTALFRRHHCRGCGKVVCRNCGSNQAPLQYRKFKPDRVCDHCFERLLKDYEQSEASIYEVLKDLLRTDDYTKVENEYMNIRSKFVKSASTNSWKKPKFIPPRLKEVSANDTESAISGWLYRKTKRSWKLFWYVLKEHVLYVYKASEDILALETLPVLGYKVESSDDNHEDVDKKLIFLLTHRDQAPIVFHAETEESAQRWFSALSTATNFDEL